METIYLLGENELGRGRTPRLRFEGYFANELSVAFFCSECGEIWGRQRSGEGRPWSLRHAFCIRHPGNRFPGSSFWSDFEENYSALPHAVLVREFELHTDPEWLQGVRMMTPQLEEQIRNWRARLLSRTLTEDEMIEVVRHLRDGRIAAQQASSASKAGKPKKAAGPAIDANSLLDEMDE